MAVTVTIYATGNPQVGDPADPANPWTNMNNAVLGPGAYADASLVVTGLPETDRIRFNFENSGYQAALPADAIILTSRMVTMTYTEGATLDSAIYAQTPDGGVIDWAVGGVPVVPTAGNIEQVLPLADLTEVDLPNWHDTLRSNGLLIVYYLAWVSGAIHAVHVGTCGHRITFTGVPGTPTITNATTTPGVQTTTGLVGAAAVGDLAPYTTHLKLVGAPQHGTVFKNNGVDKISLEDPFITLAEFEAGLKYTPFAGSDSFDFHASDDAIGTNLSLYKVTATVTVTGIGGGGGGTGTGGFLRNRDARQENAVILRNRSL